ncbi:adenylate/guanylate cyclase domain-containing protein [Actinoplanes sp. LDG1-06]|uniref:Adenylate/guanylate cyclase domain-containing protein n=1 Tax=Paractinoplanes ovalisporus TaxID=2810368 RepID=A0ABS2ADV7_9ACTN|nr:adenylate/guanylate cyclase domain-containing protein [Actinoplanes ovalisporus]MBM2617434.1 adenylate/guanylate cyclase domain-containing protein [Actinoplanes ovalisporus]
MSGRTELPSGLVTFVFTDIEGSTRLARMLGDDYGLVLGDHRSVMRNALSYFGGVELFTEGDSFFIAFHDPASAIAACVEAQRQLSAHDWPSPDVAPRVRMGMHTGWARPHGDEYASAEVHRASRVASAAHGGQILCSGATALAILTSGAGTAPHEPETKATEAPQTLLDLGPHRLRGFDDDERLFQILASGLERDFPRPRTPGAATHNLPAPITPFLGRRNELAEVTGLLQRHRIVTVAGPGGAGKTRLSLAVAEPLLTSYGDGVWNVDVAGAPNGLAPALAAALGVRTEPGRPVLETLLEHCSTRHMLIVLQTADASPAAGATLVRRLLARCPRVNVLVTSRVPLNVAGEVVWRIPPLSPGDAFTLLSERTTEARGGRPGLAEDQTDLAEVAARLEGSPLAIELAAARLRSLSAAQLAARLDDPLAALDPVEMEGGDRHESLTAVLDWSYRTLTAPAAGLLRRLAVFAGTVDLATVEWCGSADALGALSELSDKSLVEVVPGPRYRLSGQVRAYASRRLTAAGDERAARDRHAAWALHTLESVAVDTDGQPRTTSLTEMTPYVPEWETALRWAATKGSVRTGLRLALVLDPWWREHGGAGEGRDLLFRLYQRLDGVEVEPAVLAYAHLVHAGLADDRAERTRFLVRAERIARAEEDQPLLMRSLAGHRTSLIQDGRYDQAEQLCREVIAEAERNGVAESALPAVIALAELLWRRDELTPAADLLGAARQAEASCPEHRGKRTVDWLLGMVALRRGDLVAGHDHLVVALRSRLRHGFRGAAADAVAAIAVRCAMGGDPATATVLFGGAEAARGARRTEMFGRFWADQQLSLRGSLGDAAFDAAYADGVGLGFDRIVAMALAVEHPDLEDGATRFTQSLAVHQRLGAVQVGLADE